MTYHFVYGFVLKLHESIFGVIIYSMLLSLRCSTLTTTFSVFNFVLLVLYGVYLYKISVFAYRKLLSKSEVWLINHFTPLVARQGLADTNKAHPRRELLRLYQLLSYGQKLLMIMCIFYGSGSPVF